MKSKSIRGFTLIELLVVIAIIGILSSVVLSQLNTARAKGADAKVKSNLSNLRSQMELYYSINTTYPNSYKLGCDDVVFTKSYKYWIDLTEGVCNSTSSTGGWAASATLTQQNQVNSTSGIDYWCVDSTGKSKFETDPLGGALSCL